MNMHGMNQPGVGMPVNPMGMPGPVGVPGGIMQQPSPQQMQQAMQQQAAQQQHAQPAQEKLDNISKVKSLIGPLRESLSMTMKTAGQAFQQNSMIDNGVLKSGDLGNTRFDKNMEEFFSICDQIELHLKTSIQCLNQSASSTHYLPVGVAAVRSEPLSQPDSNTLTYPQYLSTVRAQVSYAKEIHDTLVAAAQNISELN